MERLFIFVFLYLFLQRTTVIAQSAPMLNDIVINEILFDPSPAGTDYIEIYNRSSNAIDLKGWHLANRNAMGVISSVKTFPKLANVMGPGEYRVLTDEPFVVQKLYSFSDRAVFIEIGTMPSYPNTSGTVVLMDSGNTVIDEVEYSEKWHFALLENTEGVSLERIDFNKASQDPGNWHSAATSAGYGTPGYKNSQYNSFNITGFNFSIEPRIFSPDNDGYNDYAIINYKFPEPGYVCNITLFNVSGYPIRHLVHSALCGLSGYFKWDGLDEKNNASSTGTYILLAEVFNLKGKTMRFKQLVTLARRLN